MGDNQAFTYFEAVIIALYNEGILTKCLLDKVCEPFRGSDIDSGGMVGTLAEPTPGPDGVTRALNVEQIVVQTFTGKPPETKPPEKEVWGDMTEKEQKAYMAYRDRQALLFSKATRF